MREFIGVNSPITMISPAFIKRQALMFSKIAVPFFTGFLDSLSKSTIMKSRLPDNCINELLWLQEKQIIFEPIIDLSKEDEINSDEYKHYSNLLTEQVGLIKHTVESSVFKDVNNFQQQEQMAAELLNNSEQNKEELAQYESMVFSSLVAFEYHQRLTSIWLRELNRMDALPVLLLETNSQQSFTTGRNEVVQIVLNSLPIPDESVSWEEIIDYRSDPDSRHRFLDLRNWMNEVARATLTPIEVEQKLEHLISQYQRHMELHRMKTNAGTLETVLVTSGEILEGLAHLQFSKAAKALFSFKHRQIALLEGELTSVGSEVAYILKAGEKFKPNKT